MATGRYHGHSSCGAVRETMKSAADSEVFRRVGRENHRFLEKRDSRLFSWFDQGIIVFF